MEPAFAPSATIAVGTTTSAFTPGLISPRRATHLPHLVFTPSIRRPFQMRSEINIAKKVAKVAKVSERLSDTLLLFGAPLEGLSVSQVSELKTRMPEGTKVMTVKNTLMRRAIVDTAWSSAFELTKNSSMWFFVKEDMKETLKLYNAYMKEIDRDAPIRGGVFEGEVYDATGVETVAALPNKKELITKIAVSIKMVPTKVARSVKAVPEKVGRAVQLAFAEEGKGNHASSDGAEGGDVGNGDAPPPSE